MQASITGKPSPSSMRPRMVMRSPFTPSTARLSVFCCAKPIDTNGRFELGRLRPRAVLDLTQFGLVLASALPLMRARDTSVTLEKVLARLPLDKSFLSELLFPFLLSCWCVEPEDFLGYSAYNALGYAFLNLSLRGNTPLCSIEGGMSRYPAAILDQTPNLIVRSGSAVTSIARKGEGFSLRSQDGRVTDAESSEVWRSSSEGSAFIGLASASVGCPRDGRGRRERVACRSGARTGARMRRLPRSFLRRYQPDQVRRDSLSRLPPAPPLQACIQPRSRRSGHLLSAPAVGHCTRRAAARPTGLDHGRQKRPRG